MEKEDLSNERGIAQLHKAAIAGDAKTVKDLLNRGVNAGGLHNRISALCAMSHHHGSVDVARHLLEAGCSVNQGGRQLKTPLYTATINNNLPLVRLLLQYGADVSIKYLTGDTAIHVAVKNGFKPLFMELLTAGSDINAANNGGDTLLHMAAAKGQHDIVKILLDAGCDVNVVKKEGPSSVSNTGITPLHYAANIGHAHVCSILIQAGADINARTNNGRSPLHLAAMSQRGCKVMDVLIANKCNLNILSTEQEESKTPLLKAVDFKQGWAVQKLIDAGADIDAMDHYGCTGLLSAIFHGYVHIVKVLIQAGCDVDKLSRNGQSPLTASLRYPPYCTKMLLLAHCQVSAQNKAAISTSSQTTWKFFGDDLLEDDIEWIINVIDNPRGLMDLTRLSIRKFLGKNPARLIHELPLPDKLKNYLLIQELDSLTARHNNYVS